MRVGFIIIFFNKLCIETWYKSNPSWQIVVLDKNTILDYLTNKDLPTTWKKINSYQVKAELIRVALIAKYGGVWMDSSIILKESLDIMFWNDIKNNDMELGGFGINPFRILNVTF